MFKKRKIYLTEVNTNFKIGSECPSKNTVWHEMNMCKTKVMKSSQWIKKLESLIKIIVSNVFSMIDIGWVVIKTDRHDYFWACNRLCTRHKNNKPNHARSPKSCKEQKVS